MSNLKDSGRIVIPKPCNCILPYRVYSALVTQEGTDAPVATVLQNTLGFDFEWVGGTGDYILTPTVPIIFDPLKTIMFIGGSSSTSYSDYNKKVEIKLHYTNTQIRIITGVVTSDILTGDLSSTSEDDILYRTPIEIRLYP